MCGSFDFQLIDDRAAASFTLRHLAYASRVSFGHAAGNRDCQPRRLAALGAPIVEKTLQFTNGIVATPVDRLHEKPAIALRQRQQCRFEVIELAVVNNVIRRLEILSAADVNGRQRC
jgi:hypothetical protein